MAALAVQLAWPAPSPADRAATLASPPMRMASAAAPPDYPQILARPLFNPARTAGGAAGAGQTASASLSDYTLVGVARVGSRSEAVFRGAAGEVVSLRVGEALLGWQLAAVEPGGVVLQQGDLRRTVPVAASAAPKTGAQ